MTMTDEPTDTAPTSEAAEDTGKKGKKGKKPKGKKEKSGRSNLVPAVVLAVGIAAGGYFMGGSGATADASAGEEVPVDPALEPGEVIELEAMNLNIDNGRFLRVGVAFLTSDEFDHYAGKEGAEFHPEHDSRLRDQLIAMYAGRELSSMTGADNLEAMKAELLERANRVLDGHALEAYLTEFVVQ
jgi:flagellar protein FliL